MGCECEIKGEKGNLWIEYCSQHEAVEDLIHAARKALKRLESIKWGSGKPYEMPDEVKLLHRAIAKAEGR